MAPHEDDEMLMAGGVIRQAIETGDEVYVVYATNGDYEGTDRGKLRISDTVNALNKIGLEKENPIETKNVKLVVDKVSDSTQAIGLAEIEVYE